MSSKRKVKCFCLTDYPNTKPTFSSSNVKPRPALILVLYLKVGQRTMGRRAPAAGRGATCKALLVRATRLRFLRPG